MTQRRMTPRVAFFLFLGCAATILSVQSGRALWFGDYHRGVSFLVVDLAIVLIFFRNRKTALAIIGLAFILVSAGLTTIFHPTLLGVLLTAGSTAGLFLIVRWHARRFPHRTGQDWEAMLDNEPK
jgi:hypothetical protein